MRTELPVCKRCCFCLPLRYGLITWGYIRLALSMLCCTGMAVAFIGILEVGAAEGSDPMNTVYTAIIGFLILLAVTDLILNIIFIVGGHTKNLKMLRAYYIYSVIICILTSILVIASAIYALSLFEIGEFDVMFHTWIFLLDTASSFAQVLVQIYVLLLVRSEIIKLRSHCGFRFVNNATEAECTLKCEEFNAEEGSAYTYERYAPEYCTVDKS